MAKPYQDPARRDASTLRRLLDSSEPLTVQRLADRMRVAGRTVLEALESLNKQGLARFSKRGGETYWTAAPGASLEALGEAGASVITGYAGTSALGSRKLTQAEPDEDRDLDDLDELGGFL